MITFTEKDIDKISKSIENDHNVDVRWAKLREEIRGNDADNLCDESSNAQKQSFE